MKESSGLVASAEATYEKMGLPSLPPSLKELLVTFAPWLSLLGGVLGLMVFIPGAFVLLVISPLAGVGGAGLGYIATIIHLILSTAGAVMSLLAFGGLRKRELSGWTRAFWASAIYVVAGLLPLSIGAIIGTAISGAVALYLLFQTKPYYDGTLVEKVDDVVTPASA